MAADVRDLLPPLRATRSLGVDGTTAELASLGGEPPRVTLAAIDRTLDWLARASDDEIRGRLVQPDRSPVLAAGVVVLRETLRHLGLEETSASERDILNGVALTAAELPEQDEGAAPPGAYTCC
jgi:exopolyphosphatase/pppGpp-phosphohydrolase